MKANISVLNQDVKIPLDIIKACNNDELVARIFYNRGYKDAKTIDQMLNEEKYNPTTIDEFPDMEIFINRILIAIENNEKICIYGDYDVDGVTSTVVLMQTLKKFTDNILYHVPDRFTEGYGMNINVIENLAKNDVALIITCDCGISNINEVQLAKDLGMDVLISDHHKIGDKLPIAVAILNPKLLKDGHRARNLSGCAMAYFICLGILKKFNREQEAEELLDMVGLSLIADVVSLNGENRYLLKKAKFKLINPKRIGLIALLNVIGSSAKIETEEDIAFQIAPRINAAGRMESARLPVELFLCLDNARALEIAIKIDAFNQQRKETQQKIIEEALDKVEAEKKNKTILILYNEHWHHGIIGIAAGKVCETYRKPAILLSLKEDGETVVGSARSIEGVDIYNLLKKCNSKLIKFGGHTLAAGLSLKKEDVDAFIAEIEMVTEKDHFIRDEINIETDFEITLNEITDELFDRISIAGPFGEGFEMPTFYGKALDIITDRKLKKNHHIMVLGDNFGGTIGAVKWNGEDKNFENNKYDFVYSIGKNNFRDANELRLNVILMNETSKSGKFEYKGSFIDFRDQSIDNVSNNYHNVEYFYEGLEFDNKIKVMNRGTLKFANTLVFLSTPQSTILFKEIINLVNPQNIVISFIKNSDYSYKNYLVNFMGILKKVISDGGKIDIEYLSKKMCVEDGIIITTLKLLRNAGKIDYFEEDLNIIIKKAERTSKPEMRMFEKRLIHALAEKDAYQKKLLSTDISLFEQLIK